MKKTVLLLATILAAGAAALPTALTAQGNHDWAGFGRYAEANAALKAQPAARQTRPDAVFIGNSITDGWAGQHPAFFADNNYVGRGISGQVTAQMLVRFRPDVLDLKPKAVVILAGTNDIALNQGFISIPNIAGNIFSMAELAKAHGIRVVICSVLPAARYPWRPEVSDVPAKVRELNGLLAEWAAKNGCTYVDYFSAMEDGEGGLPGELAGDGIHPTFEGYDRMEGIVKPVLDKILKKKR